MPFREVRMLGGCPVGLLDGLWMAQMPDGTCRQLEASQSLVTLLKHEPTTFWDTLASDLDEKNLDASAAASFPLLACIKMGLNWPTEHWQGHALRWVEALGHGNDVIPELERLVTEGRTQHIRHRQGMKGGTT